MKKIIKKITFVVGGIYLFNELVYLLQNKYKKTNGLTYETPYGNVFFNIMGNRNKEPILLLHSLDYGSSSLEWNNIIEGLEENYKIYTLDYLGYGKSTKGNIEYNPYMYVSIINNFIKDIVGEKVKVVASGLSGNYTLLGNKLDNSNISSMILINPLDIRSIRAKNFKNKMLYKVTQSKLVGDFIVNILSFKSLMTLIVNKYYFYKSNQNTKEYISDMVDSINCNKRGNKFLYSRIVSNKINTLTNIDEDLKNTQCEVLIVLGEKVEEKCKIKYKDKIVITKSNKLPHVEKPVEFLNEISIFLEEEYLK